MSDLPAHTLHALEVVEFQSVLEMVARHTVSDYGAERILSALPANDREWIAREMARVHALRAAIHGGEPLYATPTPDVRAALKRLAVQGSCLDGTELRGIAALLGASRVTLLRLTAPDAPGELASELAFLVPRLISQPATERGIERAIGEDGEVLDGASPALKKIRRELSGHRDQIVTLLEKISASLESHQRVPDVAVTVRNGRYVIAVRREGKNAVGGIVHGTSASGATLFVEPPAAIEHGNRVSELESDELREIERILLQLTDEVRPMHGALAGALDALAELDTLVARALFAEELGCAPFEIAAPGTGFVFRDARHPLLVAQGISVVPFTLEMAADERTLLISGPNTGGKTVLLKSVALLSAMLRAGIPVPVGLGSVLPLFRDFFADVGDEQSIQASLSTFSAHLRNISVILEHAAADSLVLMDEIGSGTDPVEGAALAAAVLEELTHRGATTLATTHLGSLQQLAARTMGVVNASLQFDSAKLEPTYRFVKGIPGRSYGLSIAKRLGLPRAIVEAAEEGIPEGERYLGALIASLEERERVLNARTTALEADSAQVSERARDIADRESHLRQKQIEFERESRKHARRHLLDSRTEVEKTIRELRQSTAAGGDLDSAARAARRRIEDLADEHESRLRELEVAPVARRGDFPARDVAAGDPVSIATLGGRTGRIVEIRGESALVVVGGIKLTVPRSALSHAGGPAAAAEVVPLRGDLPEEHVSTEIDLRGMRVDEAEQALIPALDAAARAGLPILRIIHGKGTGALRSRVQEVLARDNRVTSFRDGAWNEGGIGATVAELA